MTAVTRDDRVDILARVDLPGLFESHGLPQGRNKQWPCPSPSHAQTGASPPVSISNVKGSDLWHCHGCGVGGSAVDFLLIVLGITVAEVFELLRRTSGISTSSQPPPRRPKPPPVELAPLDPERGRIDGDEGAAILAAFLVGRGWTSEAADVFGLFAVRSKTQGTAIRFPYRVGGEVVWYQDRATTDRGSKWFNPPGAPRIPHAVDLVSVFENAAIDTPPSIFLVEGPADVVALWHAAPDAAVIGLPGTEKVTQWAAQLAGLDVLIVLDPDDAGDRAAAELAPAIHAAGGRSARLRPPLDLDDWRREVGSEGLAEGLQVLADDAEWWTP